MNIRGRVVFITGGARGIGLETAKKFLNEKAKVVIYSKGIDEAPSVLNQDDCLLIEGDVSRREEVKRAVQEAVSRFGGIDVLINNAGVAKRKNFEETEESDWDFIFNVNIKGIFIVTQEALKAMRDGKDKVIINIASGAGIHGIGGLSIYSISKAAVINFTQSLSQELENELIRVITVAPGSVDTQMFHYLFKDKSPKHTPKQIAEVIHKTVIGEIKPDDRLIVDVFYHER